MVLFSFGIVVFCVASLNSLITFNLKNVSKVDFTTEISYIECTVTDKIYYGKDSVEYNVRDIKIINDNGVHYLKGNAVFSSKKHKNYQSGEVLKIEGEIYQYRLMDDSSIYFYNILREDPYKINLNEEENITVIGYNEKLFQKMRTKVKSVLYNSMSENTAALSYALITGDKLNLSYDISNNFRYAGLSHILAISGLHINFLTVLIVKILSLLKAGNKTKFFVTVAILTLFTAFCGFPSSCVRAVIMAAVYLGAKLTNREYDLASSISFSALIILLISPFMLFDIGFILSFTAVGGICILYPSLKNLFKKKNFLINNLNMSLSAQAFSTPFVIATFNEFSVIGIICNLIAIPVISVLYPVLLVFVLLACLVPFLSAIPAFLELPMRLFMDISEISSKIPYGSINFSMSYLQAVLILVWGIGISRFTFFKPIVKIIFSALALLLFVALFFI